MTGRAHGVEARAVADWCQAENASAIRAFLVLASGLFTTGEQRGDRTRRHDQQHDQEPP